MVQQQGDDTAWRIEAKRTYELSPCDTFSMKALSTLACASSTASPNATISTATLFFFSFFASLTMFFSSAPCSLSGEPTKTMIRCLRFLFCLCLRASCATEMAVGISATPPTLLEAVCKALRIWPCSLVLVARTSGLCQGQGAPRSEVSTDIPFAGHGHEADEVFGIGVCLCLEDGVDCVCLCIEARGLVVAVAHVL